jgi:hypothetical protein
MFWNFRIRGSHNGDYKDYLLGNNNIYSVENQQTFRRNLSPPFQDRRISQARNHHEAGSKKNKMKLRLTFNGRHCVISKKLEEVFGDEIFQRFFFKRFIKLLISRNLVRQRTIPTEQQLLVGEVSANFSG